MGLSPGTRLGPYEIVALLGAGGMGAVYRARDTRLGREVALKVIAADALVDPATRARFQREARAIATLNHPSICTIYDVGREGDVDYLVLELVGGASLAARLRRGPLPLGEALARAREVAASLGHAHRLGIVHRDLKPANIMLTPSGAKVLDFGLARIVRGDRSPASDETATALLETKPGVVMGTLPYMAPEQIEGRTADARADVFAFGATLYEMLTAKRAFDAPSAPSLMAAILRGDTPSAMAIDPTLPASIDRVIRTCLAKDPADRFSDMHDAGVALRWAEDDLSQTSAHTVSRPGPSVTRRALIGGGLALLGGAAGLTIGGRWRGPLTTPPRGVVDLPLPGSVQGPGVAVSPDGRWVAVSLNPRQVLWLYDLQAGRWIRPQRVETNCFYPFWSPDSSEIGYLSGSIAGPDTKVWRTKVPDGEPTPVCDVELSGARTGAWLADGSIVMSGGATGLLKVASSGGEPAPFVRLAEGEQSLRFPTAADRHVLFLVQRPGRPSQLEQCAHDGSARVPVPVPTQFSGVASRGRLFYLRQGVVVGQRYDPGRAQVSGEPERVPIDAIGNSLNVGHLQIGAGGGHVAASNVRRGTRQFEWRDRAGVVLAAIGTPLPQENFSLSPDGASAAVARHVPEQSGRQLFVVDLANGVERRLVTSVHDDVHPLWSPDGARLAFRSNRGFAGNGNMYAVDLSGSRTDAVAEGLISMYPAGWTRNGELVWVSDSAVDLQSTGVFITRPGSKDLGRHLFAARDIPAARLCPSGTRIAFTSAESGQVEVYLASILDAEPRPVRVSRNGGGQPRWRADGRELYFTDGEQLIAVPVAAAPSLELGAPMPLFAAGIPRVGPVSYDPSPDGRRFLLLANRTADSFSIKLTMNF